MNFPTLWQIFGSPARLGTWSVELRPPPPLRPSPTASENSREAPPGPFGRRLKRPGSAQRSGRMPNRSRSTGNSTTFSDRISLKFLQRLPKAFDASGRLSRLNATHSLPWPLGEGSATAHRELRNGMVHRGVWSPRDVLNRSEIDRHTLTLIERLARETIQCIPRRTGGDLHLR